MRRASATKLAEKIRHECMGVYTVDVAKAVNTNAAIEDVRTAKGLYVWW